MLGSYPDKKQHIDELNEGKMDGAMIHAYLAFLPSSPAAIMK